MAQGSVQAQNRTIEEWFQLVRVKVAFLETAEDTR